MQLAASMTSGAAPAHRSPRSTCVIGAGPAGLMAAQTLAQAGVQVDVCDAMPTAGRKFLLAGKGGLNLTHGEAIDAFLGRYGARRAALEPLLRAYPPDALRAFAADLGIATFVGTSGRVFPADLKAAPLLRAWLQRLRSQGVRFHMRQRWLGWDDAGALRFAAPDGERTLAPQATVLALGGGSWARLGSDGAWVALLQARGVPVAPLLPSNCGFDVGRTLAGPPQGGWSAHLRGRFAGQPIKPVALRFDASGFARQGEFVVTGTGVEGSLVYAASAAIRDAIAAHGEATIHLDLLPGRDARTVLRELMHPRGPRTLATHLKSRLGIGGVKAALLHELLPRELMHDAARLAQALKALPLTLVRARPLAEAISSAGGVPFEALDEGLMLRACPGTFCAGEMLDWEAPTGGYLLTACFATGRAAGEGALRWLAQRAAADPGHR
ncbi:MAG: TIGR03862 family flavoprotein [Burkholderiaceae bacterium]|nr:TIGR03862 family flavoprotein [Burkholderiaceae bacterium]